MRRIIKYTIKYLFNDGLFGFFLNSIILNNRLIKICRELDALDFDSNISSNFNLSRRDYEKDTALLEKRREKMRKKEMGKNREDLSRDFTTEMILGSMTASVASICSLQGSICKRAATYDSPSNEKIDRIVSIESSLQTRKNLENIFASTNKDSCRLKNSSNLLKPFEETKHNGRWSGDIFRHSKGAASLQVASFLKNSTWNRRRRHCHRRRIVSLKPKIRKRPRLSLAFKADLVIREIFRIDPIFHESWLISIKRKFETKILNVCFCLNNVNRKIFNKNTILKLRFILDIRRNYVNFKLTGRRSHETRSRLFFTNRRVRVPICQRKHRRQHDDKVIIFKTIGIQKENLPERHVKNRKQSLIENTDRISDNLPSRCSEAGKRLEEILFHRITENFLSPSSLRGKGNSDFETPIVQTPRINNKNSGILKEENCPSLNIIKNKDEIVNLTKEVRKGQTSEVSNIIEDVCNQSYCNLETEKIIRVVGIGENEEIIKKCLSKMNIDHLTSRKIFSKEEVNFVCDPKCSCCTKVSSFFSAGRENSEDTASSIVILINNEKLLTSKLENELEEAQNASIIASAMMDVSSLFNISKKKDYQVLCPISRKNHHTDYYLSLSIQTSRMRRPSKCYMCTNPTSIIVPTINIGIQISRSKKELREEKFLNDEFSRKMKIKILSKEESKPLLLPTDCEKRFLVRKYKNPWSSVCKCDTWTRSYNRKQEKLSRGQTSRIQNNIGLRGSNSISKSFCESFYLSGIRSICRLRNVVRENLRRVREIMRKDFQHETIDNKLSDKKNFFYEKKGRANNFNGLTRRDNKFLYNLRSSSDFDVCNQRSKECKNNYLSISTRRTIKRSKFPAILRSCNRDIFGQTKYFLEMKSNDGGTRRKSEQVNERLSREKRMMVALSSTMRNDEKSINDLGLNLRSKLEQYVALCKNIKYSLMNTHNGNSRDVGRLL